MIQVLKFGGSSVANATSISRVLDILGAAARKGRVILICSAIKDCTDELLALASLAERQHLSVMGGAGSREGAEDADSLQFAEGVRSLKARHLDIIRRLFTGAEREDAEAECHGLFAEMAAAPAEEMVTFGEVFSTRIIARKLACDGVMTKWLDSRILLVKGHKDLTYSNIATAVALEPEVEVFVAPGFIASSYEGARTTLGRGGSDLSAAVYAAALKADSLQLWTDVPGIMTANPKLIPPARTIPEMSYRAALDMASHGAKVLYAPTVQPAMEAGIAINIRNTFDPENPGTTIRAAAPGGWAGVTSTQDAAAGESLICLVGENPAADLSGAGTSRTGSPVHKDCAERTGTALTGSPVHKDSAERAGTAPSERAMADAGDGFGKEVCARVEGCLKKAGIKTLSCSSDGKNVYATVRRAVEIQAVGAIHREFFETVPQSVINLYVAGYGAVGRAFMELLAKNGGRIAKRSGKVLKVTGVANSRRFILDAGGIPPAEVGKRLGEAVDRSGQKDYPPVTGGNAAEMNTATESGKHPDAGDFIEAVKASAPRRSIFLDLTDSESLYKEFVGLLREGINIVSSNRRSLAVPYVEYAAIMAAAAENGCSVRYETTVGSALPLLDGISRSAQIGEEILSIEAVVSCTLNQILSSYARYPGSFSETVRRAQEAGLTEADPRQDLAGKDALRKLLILSRQAGVPLEASDVEITPAVPVELLGSAAAGLTLRPAAEDAGKAGASLLGKGEGAASDMPLEEFYARLQELEPRFDAEEKAAARSQCRQRFLATLEKDPHSPLGYKATIAVRNVPRSHPAFRILGTENAIIVRSAYHPYPLVIQGAGEGAQMAAGSVLNEILR